MTGERHARVKQLFLEAVELDEKRRQTFLDSACGSDVALRHEVESLLEYHDPRTIILDPQSQDTRELGSGERLAVDQLIIGSNILGDMFNPYVVRRDSWLCNDLPKYFIAVAERK